MMLLRNSLVVPHLERHFEETQLDERGACDQYRETGARLPTARM